MNYKEYRTKWDSFPKYDLIGDFPIHLDIETQTSCNLRCVMCYQSFDPVKPAMMDTKTYLKIMKEGMEENLCSVKLQLRNEPLMDPRLPELIRIAKQHNIIDVMINTNAMLLTKEMSESLINSGIDTIICSVDGYTKKVYESIRLGAKYNVVYKNIKTLSKLKKKSKWPTPRIILRTIERDDIDLDEYKAFWGDIADEVVSYPIMEFKARQEDFTEYPNFCCKDLWRRLVILADGTILPCCSAAIGNTIYSPLGNVKQVSLSDAWNKVEELRLLHRAGLSHKIKMCRMCDHGEKYK